MTCRPLRCVNNRRLSRLFNDTNLIVGKIYYPTRIDGKSVLLLDRNGEGQWYGMFRFEEVVADYDPDQKGDRDDDV